MEDCLMGGCQTKGLPNYFCRECQELKVFFCEGCEVELLNDLKAVGRVVVICIKCGKSGNKFSDRIKEIKVSVLLKRAEKYRQGLVNDQKFEDSTILRDLMALVRAFMNGEKE